MAQTFNRYLLADGHASLEAAVSNYGRVEALSSDPQFDAKSLRIAAVTLISVHAYYADLCGSDVPVACPYLDEARALIAAHAAQPSMV